MKMFGHEEVDMVAPPPLIYAAPVLFGWLVGWLAPLTICGAALRTPRIVIATVLIVGGLSFGLSAVGWFLRRGTPVIPYRPTTEVVRKGPYRFTRNPMYVGMAAIVVGIGALMNSWWPIVFLPAAIVVIDRGVIVREERYLRGKFGPEYEAFTRQVRRWI